MRAWTFGRIATMSRIRDNGIRLNAVESASASVAVGAIDAHRAVQRRAASRLWIEQMRKTASGVETKSSARGCRDRAIDKVDGFGERAGPIGIGEADAPRRALGSRADRPYLAHIDQRRRQACAAQLLDDAVGGVSLRDAVQRDCGATLDESDAVRTHKRPTAADLRQRFGQLLRRRPFRIGPLRGEMIRIKLPQRLHRRIECAVGQIRQKTARLSAAPPCRRREKQECRCG